MIELCACGHELDHVGKPCRKPARSGDGVCPCEHGQRVDLATFAAVLEMSENIARLQMTFMRALAVIETATRLQSVVIADNDGRFHIEVKPAKKVPYVIVPG